ncbi:MAG TPA: formate dehydrogenase subunit gamma [Acidisphaera sp.]|nr:formate dehydrogenase subunit gamma [Acidisphaera sp.]
MDATTERHQRVYVYRYGPLQRLNHWLTATLFILLAASGLSMWYPSLFWLSWIFNGGEAARWVHPYLGCALVLSFFLLAVQFVSNNVPNGDDVRWMRKIRTVMANRHDDLPDLGKYNAGQKIVYWGQVTMIPIMFVTGLMIWQVYFGGWLSIEGQRIAILLHSLAAVIAITIIIVHVYAAFWVVGTGRAMIRGTVTGGWAYTHHRRWYRESLEKGLTRTGPAMHGDD